MIPKVQDDVSRCLILPVQLFKTQIYLVSNKETENPHIRETWLIKMFCIAAWKLTSNYFDGQIICQIID